VLELFPANESKRRMDIKGVVI